MSDLALLWIVIVVLSVLCLVGLVGIAIDMVRQARKRDWDGATFLLVLWLCMVCLTAGLLWLITKTAQLCTN